MSIIQEQDFLSHLHAIQSQNPPSNVLFSKVKNIYDIDLNTREINAPEFLGVYRDHQSETIYFRVDRYRDYMDLSNTTCVIQYTTPDLKNHLYAVPFYDVVTDRKNGKMIFPWCVEGLATKYSGPITFSVRFFIVERDVTVVDDYIDQDDIVEPPTEMTYRYVYNLSTLPARSQVLNGIEAPELESDFSVSAESAEYLLGLINQIKREGVYWDIYED